MNDDNLRLIKLLQLLDDAYRKYGDIKVALRVNGQELTSVRNIGIAGLNNDGTVNKENLFFCLSSEPLVPPYSGLISSTNS